MTSISFILPYYRLGRKLLDRAVDSILNARLACDYEIIVVDDGTPDSEASQWLDGKSSRLRYVWQENGGLSAARNKGIEMAEKEYVQFLDADDYLFADGLRQVEKLLEEEHPDVVVFRRHKKVYGEGVTDVRQRRLKTERFDSGIDYMSRRSLFAGVWSYMFRREILGGERFLPGIYHEDEDFTPRLFARSGSLISTNLMVNAYYQRQESIVNSDNADRIKKRFSDMLVVIDRLEEQERAAEEELSRYAFHRRKEQFALSVVYQAMRLLPGKEAVADVLRQLADRHCWPLPKARYTWRYSLFRHLTDREWKINVLRQLLKRK